MNFLKNTPEWFNLKNYEFINGATSDEINVQISERINIFNQLRDHYQGQIPPHKMFWESYDNAISKFAKIIQGEPQIKDLESKKEIIKRKSISSSEAIEATSSEDAIHHYLYLENKGFFAECDGGSRYRINREEFINNSLYIANREIALESWQYTQGLSVNIDLKFSNDYEILEQLKGLLPKWRKELDIPRPAKRILKNNIYRDKIYEIKLLPLFDLMLWSAIYQEKVSRKAIFSDVFNDWFNNKPIDDKTYDQTIKPNILKYIADSRNSDQHVLNIFKLPPL